MSLNVVVLVGRNTRPPELRYTSSGKAVTTFTIAVDRNLSGERQADFIPVVVWDKQAEAVANNVQSSRLLAVHGRLQIRSYEKDGQRRERAEVVASQVQFLDRGKRQDSDGGATHGDAGSGSFPMDDDEVPFLP